MESLTEKCPTTRALLHSSIEVPGIQDPPPQYIPGSPQLGMGPMERDAHIRRLS